MEVFIGKQDQVEAVVGHIRLGQALLNRSGLEISIILAERLCECGLRDTLIQNVNQRVYTLQGVRRNAALLTQDST